MSEGEKDPVRRRAVIQRLESLQRAGVTHLARRAASLPASAGSPLDSGTAVEAGSPAGVKQRPSGDTRDGAEPGRHSSDRASSGRQRSDGQPQADQPVPAASGLFDQVQAMPKLSREDRCNALAELSRTVARCTRCSELAATRTQTVFGVGNPQPRLCFLGEAPGADEDRQGEPFVGRAGQLLNDIIRACTMRREDVYILNILKCRPPGNRNPASEEAANCREYLDAQLEILQPEYICCLGAVAATNLLDTTLSIGKLRGRFHDYRGIKVMATYHPAYLLRNPSAKKHTWEDMKVLMREMGIELPQRGGK